MAADALDEPLPEWLAFIRALISRGVSVPLVVLAFDHYRFGSARWGDPVASVAAAVNRTPEEIGREVVAVCGDPHRAALVASELLELHAVIDQVPGLERGTGMIPSAGSLTRHWRAYARRRGWQMPASLVSGAWLGVLRLAHERGAGLYELQRVARRCRVRLESGWLEPLGPEETVETVAAVLGVSVEKHNELELAGVLNGPDAALVQLVESMPARLRSLPGVCDVEEVQSVGFKPETYVPAKGVTTLVPPWRKFPEPIQSMRWRMGSGEDYLHEWRAFWRSLSVAARKQYLEDNPAPPDWQNWTG